MALTRSFELLINDLIHNSSGNPVCDFTNSTSAILTIHDGKMFPIL